MLTNEILRGSTGVAIRHQADVDGKEVENAKKVSEIAYYDNMPLQNLMEIYKISHILVSTSTDDPMPTVVSYALMFGMVSIVSNRIGHAQIFNEENGIFTVYNNNEQKYAELMTSLSTMPLLFHYIDKKLEIHIVNIFQWMSLKNIFFTFMPV